MNNPLYWKCDRCGHIIPRAEETRDRSMGTCTKFVDYDGDTILCGGSFVKGDARQPNDEFHKVWLASKPIPEKGLTYE